MRRFAPALLLSCLLLPLACDKGETDEKADGGDDKANGDKGDGKKARGDGAGGGYKTEAAAGGVDSKTFTKEASRARCEELTPEFLAELYDFPVERLEDMRPKPGKKRGNYGCTEGDQAFFATVGSMWVRKTEESAKRHYDTATGTMSQGQVEAEMKAVADKATEDDKLDSKVEKKTAKTVTGAFAALTDEGVTTSRSTGSATRPRSPAATAASGFAWATPT